MSKKLKCDVTVLERNLREMLITDPLAIELRKEQDTTDPETLFSAVSYFFP